MLTHRLARPMLASVFIVGGLDALRRPKPKAAAAAPVIDLITTVGAPVVEKVAVGVGAATEAAAERVDQGVADTPLNGTAAATAAVDGARRVDEAVRSTDATRLLDLDNETYVRINGAVQIGAGVLLATNRLPRLASATLAATLIPTTVAGHRFWEADGDQRQAQQIQFAKNVSLLGGLILAAFDTDGAPTLGWRWRQFRQGPHPTAAHTAEVGRHAAHEASRHLAAARRQGAEAGGALAAKVGDVAPVLAARAADLPPAVAERASDLGSSVASHAADLIDAVSAQASEVAPVVASRATGLGHTVAERAADLGTAASKLAPSR